MKGGVLQRTVAQVQAVDDVSFDIRRGETLGLVGESGCGKTTVGRLLLRLIDPTSGTIRFDGEDITRLKGADLKRYRRRMQIIFQDPYASLDPRTPIADSIGEGLRIHGLGDARERRSQGRADDGPRRPPAVPRPALPARVLGRPAPADRDRPGARPRARPRGLRRARLGARRVDPGAGPEPAARAAGRARPDVPVRRPQHGRRRAHQRPRRGDVPGQDRGGGRPPRDVPRPGASLHAGADVGDPHPEPGAPPPAGHPPRRRAEPGQPAVAAVASTRAASCARRSAIRRSARRTSRRSSPWATSRTASSTTVRATSAARALLRRWRRPESGPRSAPRRVDQCGGGVVPSGPGP